MKYRLYRRWHNNRHHVTSQMNNNQNGKECFSYRRHSSCFLLKVRKFAWWGSRLRHSRSPRHSSSRLLTYGRKGTRTLHQQNVQIVQSPPMDFVSAGSRFCDQPITGFVEYINLLSPFRVVQQDSNPTNARRQLKEMTAHIVCSVLPLLNFGHDFGICLQCF